MSTLVESKLTQNAESSLNFRWVTEPPIIQLNSDEIASRVERLKTNLDGWGLVSVDNLGPSDTDVRDWQNPQRTQQARWNQRISSTEIMVDKDKWDKEHSTFEYRVNSEPIGIIAITKKRGGFVVPHLVTHPGSSEAGGILIEHAAQWSDSHGEAGKLTLIALDDDAEQAYLALGFKQVSFEMVLDPSKEEKWCKLNDKWRLAKHQGTKYYIA